MFRISYHGDGARMIPILSDTSSVEHRFPLDLADRCVKCGLCLPQCPTFMISHEEAESPRGRIGLMQALAVTEGAPGSETVRHLDQCLGCRRCEAVCPAQVPYGQLIDAARSELQHRGRRLPLSERLLIAYSARPRLTRVAASLARTASRLRFLQLAHFVAPGPVRRLLDLLPRSFPVIPMPTGGSGQRGAIALFTGCMGPLLEPETIGDSIYLLEAAGYQVAIPTAQGCCGAIALHAGDTEVAKRQMQRNAAAFSECAGGRVAFTASGCGATLTEYDKLIGNTAVVAHDVMHYLAATTLRPRAPAGTRLLLHQPCSQRNVVREQAATVEMLRASGAEIRELAASHGCCGAAGSYLLRQREIARRLGDRTLDQITGMEPRAVVTTNVGCAAHLRAGLRGRNSDIRVVHPVSLLAQWLRATSSESGGC